MRRILSILGVCVLLFIVETGAAKHSKKSFLDFGNIWGSDDAAPVTGNNADFTLDTEGSGLDTDVKVDNTHTDDEDFDVEASGDGDDDEKIVDLSTEAPVTEKDYYYDNKGTSDDEDDLEGSGSGDGIVVEPIIKTTERPLLGTKPSTRKQMTACNNLRNTAVQAMSAFKPECDSDGGFKKLQCMDDIGKKEKYCWCVDPQGIEITGTRMKTSKPDSEVCDFGKNLTTCVFQLVQHSQGLLGAYKPKCTLDGEYEQIQCQGSECWCVDAVGNELTGTMTNKPAIPVCPSASTPKTVAKTEKPVHIKPIPESEEPGYTVHDDDSKEEIPNVIVNIGPEIPQDSEETNGEEFEEETNAIGEPYATMKHNQTILGQPGLLAAIIGGAVVGLLCMILLVMFIVYRMRKKDEGSYPLDEQKYQNYSYAKAPDKEFYA
ncbi:uncharacterized protein LOC123540918 [Mercenaria mercenaria]|uniref:uncharacterized protein LOC123540918 n=1 Tax=Mercenaria mercenaria TaxID=6596 RepID=UPI00234F115C|nr:uncharacterized protein LOC123540918 [Mercenaria mercenaria]